MRTTKLSKIMAVLSTTTVLGMLATSAFAQNREPGDHRIYPVLDDKILDAMTVKQDNTYVAKTYYKPELLNLGPFEKPMELDPELLNSLGIEPIEKSEVKIARTIANENDPEKDKKKEEDKKEVEEVLIDEAAIKEGVLVGTDGTINVDSILLDAANGKDTTVVIKEDVKKEEEKKEETEELSKKVEEVKEDTENVTALLYDDNPDKHQINDGLSDIEKTILELENEIKDVEEVEKNETNTATVNPELEKLKKELKETKKLLAEAKKSLEEQQEDNRIVRSHNKNLEKAYCEQKDQISELSEKVENFTNSITGPINAQMNAFMQAMMMNQLASGGIRVNPGYGVFNSQNNWGMDYGLKMLGLTELFNTNAMGGITNNYYNVGGNYYGGNYDASKSTYTGGMNNPAGAYDYFSNPNMMNNMMRNQMINTPYQYDFNSVMDSTRYNGNYSYMNGQNMGVRGFPGSMQPVSPMTLPNMMPMAPMTGTAGANLGNIQTNQTTVTNPSANRTISGN